MENEINSKTNFFKALEEQISNKRKREGIFKKTNPNRVKFIVWTIVEVLLVLLPYISSFRHNTGRFDFIGNSIGLIVGSATCFTAAFWDEVIKAWKETAAARKINKGRSSLKDEEPTHTNDRSNTRQQQNTVEYSRQTTQVERPVRTREVARTAPYSNKTLEETSTTMSFRERRRTPLTEPVKPIVEAAKVKEKLFDFNSDENKLTIAGEKIRVYSRDKEKVQKAYEELIKLGLANGIQNQEAPERRMKNS